MKSFKVILVGRWGVGKSTIMVRYIQGVFSPQFSTVGLDYHSKKITFNGETFNIELWDSAGQ
jgi:small GTP-binding protein